MQGALEIPVQVTAEMDLTERNKAILEKYKQIVVSDYKEPGIDGHFDDRTKEVLKGLEDAVVILMKRFKATQIVKFDC